MKRIPRAILIVVITLGLVVLIYMSLRRSESAPIVITGSESKSELKSLTARLAAEIAPPPATQEDWKNVEFSTNSLTASGNQSINYFLCTGVRPILEADQNSNAYFTKVFAKRDTAGNITVWLWSHKALYSLFFDWQVGKIERHDRHVKIEGLKVDRLSAEQRKGNNVQIIFDHLANSNKVKAITISANKTWGQIPYDYSGFKGFHCFATPNYRVGVVDKVSRTPSSDNGTLMLLDIVDKKLLCEIPYPRKVAQALPSYVLDEQNDILIAVGYDINWVMAIDLREYMKDKPKGFPESKDARGVQIKPDLSTRE